MSHLNNYSSKKSALNLGGPFGIIALAMLASLPVWLAEHLPLQDLPFHLATTRLFHSFSDAAYGFTEHYSLEIGRTQYLLYYMLGHVLGYVVSLKTANLLLLTFYLTGTPLAIRGLLRSIGKHDAVALLSIPLLYNTLFIYGLLPFVIGIPFFFFGLSRLIRLLDEKEPAFLLSLQLGVSMVAMFYSHIFIFALFAIAFVVFFPWLYPWKWFRWMLISAPSLLASLHWLFATAAGSLVLSSVWGKSDVPFEKKDLLAKWTDVPNWLLNVFQDHTDEGILVAWFSLAILLLTGQTTFRSKHLSKLAFLPMACVLFYFTMKESHGYIWLIAQRFPIMGLMLMIPLCALPHGWWGRVLQVPLIALALFSVYNMHTHVQLFQKEVAHFDRIVEAVPQKSKVCGLIYQPGSATMVHQPFLHFVSYVQEKKGGVVNFSYAGYAHWPVDYKPGKAPPPGGPARERWEWEPHRVSLEQEIVPYYDYVLTRGLGFQGESYFSPIVTEGDWALWGRSMPAIAP